jgi:hypothetical protein
MPPKELGIGKWERCEKGPCCMEPGIRGILFSLGFSLDWGLC